MPITQARMIALIEVVDAIKEILDETFRIAKDVEVDLKRQAYDYQEAYERLNSAIQLRQLPGIYAEAIGREREHFRLTFRRNEKNAARMRRNKGFSEMPKQLGAKRPGQYPATRPKEELRFEAPADFNAAAPPPESAGALFGGPATPTPADGDFSLDDIKEAMRKAGINPESK